MDIWIVRSENAIHRIFQKNEYFKSLVNISVRMLCLESVLDVGLFETDYSVILKSLLENLKLHEMSRLTVKINIDG
jgi:hypothetical protein